MGQSRPSKAKPKKFETDPEKLGVALLSYSLKYAASVGWKSENSVLAEGKGVEDVVQDAILSLYDADSERRWKPEATPDPMQHLRSSVNSRLSSLARSYENRKVRGQVLDGVHADPDDPHENAIQWERAPWRERARDLLLKELVEDHEADLLARMYDLMENELIDKPAALAARLGVSVEDAKKAMKRFWRAWTRVVTVLREAVVEPEEVKIV